MRYSHKMWAHKDTGLLLKAVVMDESDHMIEQYSFTQLGIGGEIDRSWIGKNNTATQNAVVKPIHSAHAVIVPKESGWFVSALPPGFKKITEMNRRFRGGQVPATHLVYSDGLAGISVFIEKLGNKIEVKPGLYSRGVIQVYIKVLNRNLLTVVGEVPPRTVIQVADSVKLEAKQ